MRDRRHLVIFAKAPRFGQVKSRLAADIGPVAALRFYRQTLRHMLLNVGADRRWTTWLAVTPEHYAVRLALWPMAPRADIAIVSQGEGDLGERMGLMLEAMPPGGVVIVGADIPAVTTAHIERAFAALGDHDVVFGPAEDGGYWLVGAVGRGRTATMFDDVRWSTEHALADTIGNLAPGVRVARIDTLEDVDDLASYRRWRARAKDRGV